MKNTIFLVVLKNVGMNITFNGYGNELSSLFKIDTIYARSYITHDYSFEMAWYYPVKTGVISILPSCNNCNLVVYANYHFHKSQYLRNPSSGMISAHPRTRLFEQCR